MFYDFLHQSDNYFEDLVVQICRIILGIGTTSFCKGRDGGRDASFTGKANLFPSKNDPWKGKIIIQAKHTTNAYASYADDEFYSERRKRSILSLEIPKIKKLYINKELDYYILFSNRRSPGERIERLKQVISKKCNIDKNNIAILGIEFLNDMCAKYKDEMNIELYPVDGPFQIAPEDLSDVIDRMASVIKKQNVRSEEFDIKRTCYKTKNMLNSISDNFAKYIRQTALPFDMQIRDFLSNPFNEDIKEKYESAANELQRKILDYIDNKKGSFETVYNYAVDFLFHQDSLLRKHKMLTKALLCRMYFNCDIGITNEDVTIK